MEIYQKGCFMEEKAETKYWWIKDLIDSEAKAMGTYLSLLYLLVKKRNDLFIVKPRGASIIDEDDAKRLFYVYLAGKGDDLREALDVGKIFVDRLLEHENVSYPIDRYRILCEIEVEFYENFVKAFKKYLRFDHIPEGLREIIKEVLLEVRAQLYEKAKITAGTLQITQLEDKIKKYHELKDEEINKIISYLVSSRLAITVLGDYVFPAPCLSDEVIELIAKPIEKPIEHVEITSSIPPPPMLERFDVKPSREVLEGIVASVFEDLGFNVLTNAKKEPRRGSPIEVDVWAWKNVAGTRFSIYTSCKNWDKAIDRSVIDEENGRVLNLRELPQLKVIIAKELAAPAKETAEADGFVVIELGKKAEAENAREIYELIYRTLNELFTSIAPPRLREIASKLAEVREKLKKIEEESASLSMK